MSSTIKCFCIAVAGVLTASGQNFLLNPSFESPAVGDGGVLSFSAGQTIGVGWVIDSTAFGTPVIDKGYASGGVVWAPPTDGNQYLYVGDSASAAVLHQDIPLAAAGSYRLSFDLANFLSVGFSLGAAVNVDFVDLGSSLSIIGGPQLFSRPAGSGYAAQELNFNVPHAGDYRLVLENLNGAGSNVDNFSLTAVPEPESCAAIAGAVALGFAVFRRLRQS